MGKILYEDKSVSDVIYIAREFGEPNAQGFAQMVNVEHEVAKIYYGTTLVYEKPSAPTTYVADLVELTNCTTDIHFPYDFNGTMQVVVTPPSISDGQWSAFNYYYVGTGTSGSALYDVAQYTYSNTKNGSTPTVSVSGATSDLYFSFNHKKGTLTGTEFEVFKASGSSSASTNIDLYTDCGMDIPDEPLNGRTVRIKGIICDCSLYDYHNNVTHREQSFDATLVDTALSTRWSGRLGTASIYVILTGAAATATRKIRLYASGRSVELYGCVILKQIEIY